MDGVPEALAHYDRRRVEEAVAAMGADTEWMRYADGDRYFALWLRITSGHIQRHIGLGLFDLADATLRDYYDDGMSALEAAQAVVEADDTGFEW
jgi:hypothetical protein